MLVVGLRYPTMNSWTYTSKSMVDMTPWRFVIPCSVTLLSCVVALYLLFSKIGLVGGLSIWFWPLLSVVIGANGLTWWLAANERLPLLAVYRPQ